MIQRQGNCVLTSEEMADCPVPSNSSSDEGLHTPTKVNVQDAHCAMLTDYRLKRCSSTPVLPFTSTPIGFRGTVNRDSASVQLPIVGFEVMEERARFTVYKIKIENKDAADGWFIFRRYTDFVRLHSKLKSEFPKKVLPLPRKRWFGNNFSLPFIHERIEGLQHLISMITADPELLACQTVRDFFCLDEPPSYTEIGEESRAMFEALEDTIYQLRKHLVSKEAEVMNMRMAVTAAQEKAVTITQKLKEMASCEHCSDKVQGVCDELQRVLCLQFSNSCS